MNNQVNLGHLEKINEIFNVLNNQQEIKNLYKKIDEYISEIGVSYSIWQIDHSDRVVKRWEKVQTIDKENNVEKNKDEEQEKYDELLMYLMKHKKNKTPIIEKEDFIYAIIPIISREEVIGFLCIDKKFEDKERWAEIYTTVQILGFAYKYYEMIETMKDLSYVDVVTGLYNYRHFRFQIDLEVDKANRFKKPLTLVFIKIKDFGEINRKLGFSGGEGTLKEFSKLLKKEVRKTDMPSKINEEVFAILMYDTDAEGAAVFVDRLNKVLNARKIKVEDIEFNISIESQIKEYKKNTSSEEFFEDTKEIK